MKTGRIRLFLFVVFGLLCLPLMTSTSTAVALIGVAMFIAALACYASLSWDNLAEGGE